MAKILGLDLGTNSIGWALIDNSPKMKEIKAGVTTFQQGVNLKKDGSNEEPLNVAKRKARQMRRQVFYKDYRLTKMTEVLARFNMFPYLDGIENDNRAKQVIIEIKERFGLSDQQLKNHRLNKYKDSFQLNARIAKLLFLLGLENKKPSSINVDFNTEPKTLDELLEHLLAFISLDPYRLRSEALNHDKKITRIEFGRILYQIGKRRGFKSGRKVKNKAEETGSDIQEKEIKKANKKKNWKDELEKLRRDFGDDLIIIDEDDEKIKVQHPKKKTEFYAAIDKTKNEIELGKYITLGNYLYHKNSYDKRIRKETKTDRKMYVDEFKELWNRHAEPLGLNIFSGEIRKRKKKLVEVSLKEFLGDERKGILFYQRPLKSQKHLVALCNFENNNIRLRNKETNEIITTNGKEQFQKVGKQRCLISHPLFEKFRALQQINNLKIRRNGIRDTLNNNERNKLLELFTDGCNEGGKIAIKKVLIELGITKDQLIGAAEGDVNEWENQEISGSFAGNYSTKKLIELFASKWNNFDEFPQKTKEQTIKVCVNQLGGESTKHDFDFRTKSSKEERKNVIHSKGVELWHQLSKEEQNQLCLEKIREEIWHCFSYYEDGDLLWIKLKDSFGLDDNEENKEKVKKLNLKDGYGSLSLKAIKKLLPFMEEGVIYSDAIFLANIKEVIEKENFDTQAIKDFLAQKKVDEADNYILNSVLTSIKKEYQKLPQPKTALTDERIEYWTRKKATSYLREYKGFIQDKEFENGIQRIIEQAKLRLHNPLKPDFTSTEPVVDTIKNYLQKTYNVSHRQLGKLWHPAKVEHLEPSTEELPEPKFKTLRNPIVKQALYSLRGTIKAIEQQYGKPDLVRIELTRELNDKNKRIAIRKWNKQQERERDGIKAELNKLDKDSDNEENILKYKLWKELQEINGCHICIYTGSTICVTDLFENNKFQIEHIIPRSRSWSDAATNLTLCETSFNEFKDKRTPFELQECENLAGYKKDWSYYKILQRVEGWKKKSEGLTEQIDKILEDLKGLNPGNSRDLKLQSKHLLTFERNYYQS